jgi:hypothetical protein
MAIPEALDGVTWTRKTARNSLPILVACARSGTPITYGQLDAEIVGRKLGHHVMEVQYGYPAGAIGDALIEIGERWNTTIPPLNALVVNAKTKLPGKGVNYYLKHYFKAKTGTSLGLNQRRAVVEEIQADIYSYRRWDKILKECGLEELTSNVDLEVEEKDVAAPGKGGWSSEPESEEHQNLKKHIAANPQLVNLGKGTKATIEFRLSSADMADVVFTGPVTCVGVEVKSIKSNDVDLNRGIFQAVKYQAVLRAEQKARFEAPTAWAVLVSERPLPSKLRNLAKRLGIEVFVVRVN